MFSRRKKVFTELDSTPHPEHQERNTTVSEYLRKFGQGKINEFPQDSRPEVTDERTVDQMLDDDARVDHMATDELDVLMELERKKEDFEAMEKDIEMTEKQKAAYDDAMAVLNNPNSSFSQKQEAYEILDELIEQGKATRTRARN